MNKNIFKEFIFRVVLNKVKLRFNDGLLNKHIKLKTISGNTQHSERQSILLVKNVLDELNLNYKEASSQQSKDFRIYLFNNDEPLYIEVKKTDSCNIFFNDTLPNIDIYYILIFTGNTKIKPQCIGINGYEFIKNDLWVFEYQKELNQIKSKYCGTDSTIHRYNMKVYPRPTYQSNIKHLLDK